MLYVYSEHVPYLICVFNSVLFQIIYLVPYLYKNVKVQAEIEGGGSRVGELVSISDIPLLLDQYVPTLALICSSLS